MDKIRLNHILLSKRNMEGLDVGQQDFLTTHKGALWETAEIYFPLK